MQPYDAYEPCGSCRRHVKRQEASCPFCGAARTPAGATAPRRIRNVSRAQWLAFGSTLLGMGCNAVLGSATGGHGGADASNDAAATSSEVGTPNAGEGGGTDASLVGDEPAAAEAGATSEAAPEASDAPWGPPNASCPRSGTFACGSSACDRATQYCVNLAQAGNPPVVTCEPLANMACLLDSGTCAACPTCACIPPGPCMNAHSCSCFEDNLGGLTIACSQGGCYGSPPARLGRALQFPA